MSTASRRAAVMAAVFLPCTLAAQQAPQTAQASAQKVQLMSKDQMIASALSAGPKNITQNAAVLGPGADGKMVELRPGTNGWTCLPDNPQTPGLDPMCFDAVGLKWAQAWMSHTAPAITQPGIAYMLAGGSDISATDPFATKTDHYISSPPHWMLLWAVDPKTSGLPTTPKTTGTWIMWAGTPYAHLMINQVP
jgi:hypothetical protein